MASCNPEASILRANQSQRNSRSLPNRPSAGAVHAPPFCSPSTKPHDPLLRQVAAWIAYPHGTRISRPATAPSRRSGWTTSSSACPDKAPGRSEGQTVAPRPPRWPGGGRGASMLRGPPPPRPRRKEQGILAKLESGRDVGDAHLPCDAPPQRTCSDVPTSRPSSHSPP